ncbi:M43 family zinc metalloprotease [Flavobacterium wongokense]|uniref:M43 family zinc metalloprotease n=1 Tax=Flavobacterium wongokense TaxID=2910674 RepID=UPI001EED984B|nr:M43 family zinc metalloprotease [Flavobacterium sp. WG47]MCF6130898.1 hypothetical protein [Flavobacterium sp. WG47]
MKTRLLLLFLYAVLATSCRSVYNGVQLPAPQTDINDTGQTLYIPVVFHVLYKNEDENVKDADIIKVLNTLKFDFAGLTPLNPLVNANRPADAKYAQIDTNIRFFLAEKLPDGTGTRGIIRHKTSTSVFKYKQRKAFAESPMYDPYRYLNVYICDTNTGAYTPTETTNHGIVIDYENVIENKNTLTHEAGHWLGLWHIFEGGCSDGDGIEDTYAQKKFFGNKKYLYKSCNDKTMITNFMGYADNRDFFTEGQKKEMRQFILQYMPIAGEPKSIDELEYLKNPTSFDAAKMVYLQDARDNTIDVRKIDSEISDISGKYSPCVNPFAFIMGIKDIELIKHKPSTFFAYKTNMLNDAAGVSPFNLEASILNEASTLIADQFEKELLNMAVHRFFRDIIEPDKDDADKISQSSSFFALLPLTSEHIRKVYNAGNPYTGLDITALQINLRNDIKNIPKLFMEKPELLLPQLNSHPMVKDMLKIGNEIIKNSKLGTKLPDIINKVSALSYSSTQLYELTSVLAIISNGLIAEQRPGTFWYDPLLELDPLKVKDDEFINKTYFYLKSRLCWHPAIRNYINQGKDEVEQAQRIKKLLLFVNKLNDTYTFLKNKSDRLDTLEDQIAYLKMINDSVYEFLNTVYQITELNDVFGFNEKIIKTSGALISITEALVKKEYPNAMLQIVNEFGHLMKNHQTEYKLLVVAAQIASDKDDVQLKKILKNYIAPIGTSSQKRISPFNISLNSYAGVNGGFEWVKSKNDEDSWYAGVTAPIGLSFSFWPGNIGSLSLFMEFLDIGSLVNTRFKNDNATYGELRFEHFLSLGGGLFYNFKNTPLTIGARCNHISNLRDITYEEGSAQIPEKGKSVWRLSFSVLIDIPLFTIYNKTKK